MRSGAKNKLDGTLQHIIEAIKKKEYFGHEVLSIAFS